MKFIITALLGIMTISANSQIIQNKTITIDPYLSLQYYEHFKRLTLSSPDSQVEYLEGFEFAWGYTYKISVRETELSNVRSDGTRYSYTLNRIISKEKVPDSTQFGLFLDANRYYHKVDSSEQEMNKTLHQINDSTFLYFEDVEIEVPYFLMEDFKSITSDNTSKVGTFIYVNEKRIRLVKL
jgi:hypothetical protein